MDTKSAFLSGICHCLMGHKQSNYSVKIKEQATNVT